MEKIDLKKYLILINKAKKFKNVSVVAKRVKRSEGYIFMNFLL